MKPKRNKELEDLEHQFEVFETKWIGILYFTVLVGIGLLYFFSYMTEKQLTTLWGWWL